jgi:hypothetical protein
MIWNGANINYEIDTIRRQLGEDVPTDAEIFASLDNHYHETHCGTDNTRGESCLFVDEIGELEKEMAGVI